MVISRLVDFVFPRKLQAHRRPNDRRRIAPRPRLDLLEDRLAPSASLWTDKLDYAPGETAFINGSGYAIGESVRLEVTRSDGTLQGSPDNPWTIVDGGAGDLDGVADGNFQTTWYVEPEFATNQTLIATARGLSSGETASATFTDSRTITSVTLNGGSSVTVLPGQSIAAVVDVTTTGNGNNANWRSSGWVISTTAPSTYNIVDHANHDGAGDYSESFTITAPTTAGTYSAYFAAYQNDG